MAIYLSLACWCLDWCWYSSAVVERIKLACTNSFFVKKNFVVRCPPKQKWSVFTEPEINGLGLLYLHHGDKGYSRYRGILFLYSNSFLLVGSPVEWEEPTWLMTPTSRYRVSSLCSVWDVAMVGGGGDPSIWSSLRLSSKSKRPVSKARLHWMNQKLVSILSSGYCVF